MTSLRWKMQRIRAMSPAEIGVRTSRELRNLLSCRLLSFGVSPRGLNLEIPSSEESPGYYFRGRFFFDPQDELLRARLEPVSARCISEADEALNHRVSLLGRTYDVGREIDWHYDYRLNRRCPIRYSGFIDLKDPNTEESVRWVWYFNRHRHLATLGRAYFITQKKEYAQEILRQLCGWVEQNPPCAGVNWTASLEIALRLFSWTWALYPLRNFAGFTPLAAKIVVRSMMLQTGHLFRNLSVYSSANNHLIAQGMTLFVMGTLFSGVSEAAKWKERGLSILWREILAQTYGDGVSKEQSLHYHCFVCELYSAVLIFAERNGIEVPASARDRFRDMCDFLLSISGDGGRMPQIGDSDDQTVVLPADEDGFLSGLMACAGYITGEDAFAPAKDKVPIEAALLIGNQGLERLQGKALSPSLRPSYAAASNSKKVEHSRGRGSRIFSEGGYCVFVGEDDSLHSRSIFDCGELGLGKTAAHGHADCLSFTMNVNGTYVLIDPGTFTYHSKPEWRAYFRSTPAHNTVSVDGLSQSEMLGPFVWYFKANPTLHDAAAEDGFDFVTASHDGYLRLSDPVMHKRILILVKPAFVIAIDSLNAKDEHVYEQNFHFGGDASLVTETGPVQICGEEASARSLLFSPLLAKGMGTLICGQEKPIMGWRSRIFWHKEPCRTLSIKGKFRGPVLLESCILTVTSRGAKAGNVSFSNASPEGRTYSLIRREMTSCVETSLVNLGEGLTGERCLESDASYLCMREFSAGGALEVFGRNVGKVLRNGELLIEATEKSQFVNVKIDEETVRFDARGAGRVLVRAHKSANIVSSAPAFDYKREGEFIRITPKT